MSLEDYSDERTGFLGNHLWDRKSVLIRNDFYSRAGYANCLLDKPNEMKTMERRDGRLPGEDYSENKQCELVFGQGSRICPHMVSDGKSKTFSSRV